MARWFLGRPIGKQLFDGERVGMHRVHVESMHQRRTFENDTDSRMAATMNSPFVTFGQAKPAFQLKVVSDRFENAFPHEQAGEKARHYLRHLPVNRIVRPLESIDQSLEGFLPLCVTLFSWFEGCGNFLDLVHIGLQRLLFGSDFVETSVDAVGQSAELLLCEAPFFSSRFRWIDFRTSLKASAIRMPGG